jgi:hypothetical protein
MSACGTVVLASVDTRKSLEKTRSISTFSPILPMATSKNLASLSATVGGGRRRRQTQLLTPFIGREKDLGVLTRRSERSLAGDGQFVLVPGEPGIGKSRLVEEFRGQLSTDVMRRVSERAGGVPLFVEEVKHFKPPSPSPTGKARAATRCWPLSR